MKFSQSGEFSRFLPQTKWGNLKKNFQNFYSLSFHFIYFFKSKSGNTKTMQIYSFRSAKFNFMQVVHPMLTSFHCVLDEIQAKRKWTRYTEGNSSKWKKDHKIVPILKS